MKDYFIFILVHICTIRWWAVSQASFIRLCINTSVHPFSSVTVVSPTRDTTQYGTKYTHGDIVASSSCLVFWMDTTWFSFWENIFIIYCVEKNNLISLFRSDQWTTICLVHDYLILRSFHGNIAVIDIQVKNQSWLLGRRVCWHNINI